MPPAPRHAHEADRLASLRSYGVLDGAPDPSLDAITAAVAHALDVPVALVTLLDDDRQCFVSRVGLEAREMPRELSFCAYAVAEGKPLLVPDATLDPRFVDHPLVVSDPGIRFYVGAPLVGRDGLPLGTLCVVDGRPRPDAERALAVLDPLARTVTELLELRRRDQLAGMAGPDLLTESRRLRRAIDDDELVVAYQPVFGVGDLRLAGVEALVRWRDPEVGLRPPADFLPVAESSGLVVALGRTVLRQACRQTQLWRTTVPAAAAMGVAVNVSGRQLLAADLVASVDDALAESGLPADALTLELTETALAERDPRVHRALAELRERGIKLALDDFGTGYSNLSYLQRFAPDTVKLDRFFVQTLGRSERGDVIAAAMVDVARRLRCQVVAEGVETPDQAAAVERLGCTHVQGFLYSPPVFPEELFPAAALSPSRSSA